MTPQAEDALRRSINAWKCKRAHAEDGDVAKIGMGSQSCPLCDKFMSMSGPCGGCPVKERTQQNYCKATPHDGAIKALRALSGIADAKRRGDLLKELVDAIQLEIDFLHSLLPGQGDVQQ